MESQKRNWLNASKKLSKDVQIAERSLGNDDEIDRNHRRDQMKAREENFSRIQRRLDSFKVALCEIKERLDSISHGQAGAEVIQPMLETFEKKLTDFNIVMCDDFADLEKEEKNLTRELSDAAIRFESFMTDNNNISKESGRETDKQSKSTSQNRLQVELDRYTKIGAIDKQLANMGGRTGGWDLRDHDSFTRVWTQLGCSPVVVKKESMAPKVVYQLEKECKDDEVDEESYPVDEENNGHSSTPRNNVEVSNARGVAEHVTDAVLPRSQVTSLLRKLPLAVPGKLEEEFEDHIQWYLKYLSLNAEKKKLMIRWKEAKLSEEKNNVAVLIDSVSGREVNHGLSAENLLREAAAEIEERANSRLKVSQWRAEKKQQEEQALLKKNDSLAHANKLREEEVKRRQTMTRVQLDLWREAESSSQSALKRAEEEAARLVKRSVSVDPADARRRRMRDLESTRLRQQQLESYKKSSRPRSELISEISAGTDFTLNARRDPGRLLAPTKASASSALSAEYLDEAETKRAMTPAHSSRVAMSGRDLQFSCRAIPTWRRPPS